MGKLKNILIGGINMGKNDKSTHPTLKAAKKFNRRTALKRGAAAAAFAGVAPMYVKNAFAA